MRERKRKFGSRVGPISLAHDVREEGVVDTQTIILTTESKVHEEALRQYGGERQLRRGARRELEGGGGGGTYARVARGRGLGWVIASLSFSEEVRCTIRWQTNVIS
jgi:hypothetical protein